MDIIFSLTQFECFTLRMREMQLQIHVWMIFFSNTHYNFGSLEEEKWIGVFKINKWRKDSALDLDMSSSGWRYRTSGSTEDLIFPLLNRMHKSGTFLLEYRRFVELHPVMCMKEDQKSFLLRLRMRLSGSGESQQAHWTSKTQSEPSD